MLEQRAGDKVRDCGVIEVLLDHEKCLHEYHLEPSDHAATAQALKA